MYLIMKMVMVLMVMALTVMSIRDGGVGLGSCLEMRASSPFSSSTGCKGYGWT
jgi:hypothetical protein